MISCRRWSFVSVLIFLLPLFAGCGGSSLTTHKLSGNVTYNGQPVPVGTIVMSPNTARGNSGPGTIAGIKDGKYETAPDKGHTGGEFILQITGYDGVPVESGEGGMDPMGTQMFPIYEMAVDLPTEDSTLDIEVPAAAGS